MSDRKWLKTKFKLVREKLRMNQIYTAEFHKVSTLGYQEPGNEQQRIGGKGEWQKTQGSKSV